jgi:hypothetical protein
MERREAVKYISILLGGTMVGANAFLTGCKTSGEKKEWSEGDIAYLNEIAETILPQTSSPGAKAANVGQYMTVMVNDCYEAADQKIFREGMDDLDKRSEKQYDAGFMKISPQQRKELLIKLDAEVKDHQKKRNEFNKAENQKEKEAIAKGGKYEKKLQPAHYFQMMKELTLSGYFTSEIGMTKARRYTPVPGRFDPCVPYTKGEKAWA